MAVSKVQLSDGTSLVDLTADTVDAAHLCAGYTAHDKAGNAVSGSLIVQGFHVVQSQPSAVVNGDLYFMV